MKKLMSALLLFILIFSVFASCKQAQSATDGTERTEGTTLASSKPTEETDPLPTAKPTEPTEPSEPEPMLTLDPDNMPEDFSFSLQFNVMGCCYYDSAKDELCGGAHEDDPEKYTTSFHMSEEQLSEVYRMIAEMDISSYPRDYDPINDPESETMVGCDPEEILVLTVRAGGIEKSVHAKPAYMDEGYDERSQAFLDVCRYIEDILYDSEEWKALPDNKILFC